MMIEITKAAMGKLAEHQLDIARNDFTWIRRLIGNLQASVIKALWEARIPPFDSLPLEIVDDILLAQTYHNIESGWEAAQLVKGMNPYDNWSDSEARAVAAAAQAVGLNVYYTDHGYWGGSDYLITRAQPIAKTLEECEGLEDYVPSDLNQVKLV